MLSQDFDGILEEFGYNVLLVKQSTKLRCSCWNEKNQEASRECPVCFGLGTVPIIEKHTTRSQSAQVPLSLPRSIGESPLGDISSSARAFFFKPEAKIKKGDLIVEVDWSETGKPIYSDGEIFEVNFIDPKRFERGMLTFIKVYGSGTPIYSQMRGVRIANSNGIRNYEIISDAR